MIIRFDIARLEKYQKEIEIDFKMLNACLFLLSYIIYHFIFSINSRYLKSSYAIII